MATREELEKRMRKDIKDIRETVVRSGTDLPLRDKLPAWSCTWLRDMADDMEALCPIPPDPDQGAEQGAELGGESKGAQLHALVMQMVDLKDTIATHNASIRQAKTQLAAIRKRLHELAY